MAESLTSQLIARDVQERHDELLRQFAQGVAQMCVALSRIRAEETYRVEGFDSFGEFLDQRGISRANGTVYAELGPLMDKLVLSGEAPLVAHPDMLKPIHQMTRRRGWTLERCVELQLKVVRATAREAKRQMVPLTGKLVAEVAQRQFGWLTPVEYRKRRRRERGEEEAPAVDEDRELRETLEQCFRVILAYQMTGPDMVRRIGPASEWLGFDYVLEILQDARDAG